MALLGFVDLWLGVVSQASRSRPTEGRGSRPNSDSGSINQGHGDEVQEMMRRVFWGWVGMACRFEVNERVCV